MRVVLDTNIFVSMALGGRVARIHDAWKAKRFVLIASDAILSEYVGVLSRPQLHLTAEIVSLIVARVHRQGEFVIPAESIHTVAADPSDDKFLEGALAGQADCIVSGDSHLLDLGAFRGIPILTAREFIERLESG